MRRMLFAIPIVCILFSIGCSQMQAPTSWQAFTPQVTTLTTVLTQQALTGKSDTVRQGVNAISGDVYDVLSGSFELNATKINEIVIQVTAKYSSNPVVQIARPIVEAVLLVGLQMAQAEVNRIGTGIVDKNELVMSYVKAACKGIADGSAAPIVTVQSNRPHISVTE